MTAFPNVDIANKWAKQVVSGKIPTCKWVKLACQRHLNDLIHAKKKEFPYKFEPKLAEKKIAFIELLPHTKGEWAMKKMKISLEPWQKFGIACTFGWTRKKDGFRRFRESYWEVPRKNGKSAIAAGVALNMFANDGEFGSEVYAGATTEKQAWEVFKPARLMAVRSPEFIEAAGILINAGSLEIPDEGSVFEPITGDPPDGQSPHCAVVDEFHEHQTSSLYDTMQTGMGARRQPMIFTITTAGFNIEGPCYDLRGRVQEMLLGTVPDDELFGWIWTIDDGDDWTDPKVLAKANPNYGVSVYGDYLESQQRRAIQNASKQNAFKTKHLNVWVSSRTAYFNMEKWQGCTDKNLKFEDFFTVPCLMPIDLASKIDICARINLFYRIEDGKLHYYCIDPRFYLPEDTVMNGEEKQVIDRYQKWMNLGFLEVHDGYENDFTLVASDLINDASKVPLTEVPYDEWGGFQVARDITDAGYEAVKIPKNVKTFSPAMKELVAAISSGRFHHDGNPILSWMIGNVISKPDANENDFPRKEKSAKKIDGAVALLMGISRILSLTSQKQESNLSQHLEKHGVRRL
ncbi:terminase TerL endonuclease subunit [Acinetobacter sp. NIPH 2699]|uniref:terminase large subunit n=1 Tax=Acinetobacter sp. NIPH 2699 TaxID=2923433 RepID=UPI001F4BA134|nr:terminase TerL endonuclease subunit [Acinetobacter sp. NIPH 2699]MCH7337121.1 terminase large subunit [Acinetobacter sp. NIPH 2699]